MPIHFQQQVVGSSGATLPLVPLGTANQTNSLYTNSGTSSANHTEETLLLLAGTPPPVAPMVGELVPVLVGSGQYNSSGSGGNSMKIGLSGNVSASTLPEVVENSVLQQQRLQQQQQQQHSVYTLQEEPEDRDLENDINI